MNPAHLHIILNHIPVIGIPFGMALLVWGFLRKSHEITRTGLLVFAAIALVTIPTYLTGEAAEDIVEHLPGVSDDLIDNHEDAAKIALVATSVLGGLSLIRLLIRGRFASVGGPLTVLVFVFSVGVAGWLARTANLGGQIRHPEIRQSSTAARNSDTRENEKDKEDEHADDAREFAENKEKDREEEVRENEESKDEESGRRRRGRGRGRHGRGR